MGARSSPGAGETIHATRASPLQGAGCCQDRAVPAASRLVPVLAAVLTIAAVLTGCSGDDDTGPAATSSSSATTTSAPGGTSSAPATGGGYTGEDGTDAPPPD